MNCEGSPTSIHKDGEQPPCQCLRVIRNDRGGEYFVKDFLSCPRSKRAWYELTALSSPHPNWCGWANEPPPAEFSENNASTQTWRTGFMGRSLIIFNPCEKLCN